MLDTAPWFLQAIRRRQIMAEALRKSTKMNWTPLTEPGLRTEIGHTNIVQI
jgi:hypothetical protein